MTLSKLKSNLYKLKWTSIFLESSIENTCKKWKTNLEDPPGPRGITFFLQKNWKVLKIAWNGEKIDQKIFQFLLTPPPSQTHASKMSAGVDGGLSGGSRMRRPGSEDPIGASGNLKMETASILFYLTRELI